MKNSMFSLVAIGALVAGPALAADLRMPVKAPPAQVEPVLSWTGFYIGANAGVDWFNKDWSIPLTPINIAGGCPGCPKPAGGHAASSLLAGGQVGFNYQIDKFVIGAEAQADWTQLEASNVDVSATFITDHSKTDSLGTIAARGGVAWGPALLFVKGGGAWAHDKFWTSTATIPIAQSLSETRWGWMIGGGIEYAFWNNWSVKIEYDHLDLGSRRETLAPVAAGVLPFEYDVKQTIDLVQVGVNYRFNFAGPIAARY